MKAQTSPHTRSNRWCGRAELRGSALDVQARVTPAQPTIQLTARKYATDVSGVRTARTTRRTRRAPGNASAGARPALHPALGETQALSAADLNPREARLLDLLAQGLNTAAIAERLGVSPKTVRNRLSEIFTELDVTDRVAAVALARDAGLGRRPPP